jgi:hypothetical protein
MKRVFLFLVFLLATSPRIFADTHTNSGRFQVFQSYICVKGLVKEGQDVPKVPMTIKIDTVTGESWHLVLDDGAWWVPIKHGTLINQK